MAYSQLMVCLKSLDEYEDLAVSLICAVSDPILLDKRNHAGQSALVVASIYAGNSDAAAQMIRMLVVLGANVAIPDLHGHTAVHYCAHQGHIEPLKALLSPLQAHELELRAACLPCCAHLDTIGAYALEYRQRVLSTLLMRDVNGMTPLALAHLAR